MKILKKLIISSLVVILLATSIKIESALAATYQEQLDKGFVEWTGGSVQTLYLRKNQTYYMGLSGGRGGNSGCSWDRDYEDYKWRSYTRYGDHISKFYKVKVLTNDIRIDIGFGEDGLRGEDGIQQNKVPKVGGAGGNSAFSLGKGDNGTASRKGPSYFEYDYAGQNGGGGGGGGASVIKFNNNISQRICASGGNGANAPDGLIQKSDGRWYYTGYPGEGGQGHVVNNSTSITGIEFTEITAAEANIYGVRINRSKQIVIFKEFVPGEGAVKFEDLQNGAFIALPDREGKVTVFTKFEGAYIKPYSLSGMGSSTWSHFPEYVTGFKQNPLDTQAFKVKDDLTFIGGDGTLNKPFYHLPAGVSSVGSGGGSGRDYTREYEKIAQGLVYLGEKQEQVAVATLEQIKQVTEQTKVLERQTQSVIESNKALNKPNIKHFGLKNGASISATRNVEFALVVEDNRYSDEELAVAVSEIGGSWVTKTLNNGAFTHSFSFPGYKTLRVRATNPEGSYSVETLSFFVK